MFDVAWVGKASFGLRSVMKSLFSEVKKTPTAAGAFKFAFKLGGDEDLEDEAQAGPSKAKKNKKKKKKKPAASGAAQGDVCEDGEDDEDEKVSGDLHVQLSALTIDAGTSQPPATAPSETAAEATATLSKTQKKNKKRAKGKGTTETGEPVTPPPASTCPPAQKKPDTSVVPPAQKPITKELPKLSQTSKGKAKNSLPAPEDDFDFDFDAEVAAAIAHNKTLAPAKPAKPLKSASPVKGSKSSSGSASTSSASTGPIYLSSKDPELDEAARQRCRFGMGKNLVAIGPAKVRGTNWLQAPPGLTLSSGALADAAPRLGEKATGGSLSGAFGKKAGGDGAKAPASLAPRPQQQEQSAAGSAELSHSSPFSFSFNGL